MPEVRPLPSVITDIATAHNTVVVVMNRPIIFKYTKVPSVAWLSTIRIVVAVIDPRVKEVGD